MLQQSFGLPQPILETLTLPRTQSDSRRHLDPQQFDETRTALLETLDQYRIPVKSQWGKGSAKTVDDLVTELERGECTLLSAGGRLVREFCVARVDLYYWDKDGKLLRLKEDRQIFNDGRERNRAFDFAVGEKAKPLERPFDAAHRGLAEELQIHDRFDLAPLRSFVEIEPAKDFPGIPSISKRADYRLILPENHYRAEGYVDQQTDKKTIFLWVPAPFQALPEAKVNKLLSF